MTRDIASSVDFAKRAQTFLYGPASVAKWSNAMKVYCLLVFRNNALISRSVKNVPCLEVIKLFSILNSTEHEICPANKSQITNNCKFFLAKHS